MFDLHTEKSEFARPPFPNCHKTQNLAISYQLARLIYTNPIHFFLSCRYIKHSTRIGMLLD